MSICCRSSFHLSLGSCGDRMSDMVATKCLTSYHLSGCLQISQVSTSSREDVSQLLATEAQPEVDKLKVQLEDIQRCAAAVLQMQTQSCTLACKAMADLMQEAEIAWADFSKRNKDSQIAIDGQLQIFLQVCCARLVPQRTFNWPRCIKHWKTAFLLQASCHSL